MRIKKRYIGLGLLTIFIGVLRLEFFAFRESDEKQAKKILKSGQSAPTFYTYNFEGRDMHYLHVGDPEKPLLILVHGSPGSSIAMQSYLADTILTMTFQVIAVDRLGFGYSDYGHSESSLEKQSAAILKLLDRHPAEATYLMGHSYGGPVISRMAMDAPERIAGLCIVSGSIDPSLEPREWWRKPLNWPVIRHILPGSLRASNQEIMDLYQELEDMMPLWKKISCPVLVIQGEADKLVPAGNAFFAKKMLEPNTQIELKMVPGGNHFILWSMQEEIRNGIINQAREQ